MPVDFALPRIKGPSVETAILGEGIIQIRADFSRMRQQMGGMPGQMSQGGSAAGAAFAGAFVGSIAGAGIMAAAKLAAGLFDRVSEALVDFTAQTIQTNAQMERMKTSFGVLTGGATQAGMLLREVVTFAKDTPFEIPGLTQAATQLLATGVQADRVVPMLKKIGDAAAGSAQGFAAFPRMTLAISQMLSAGRVGGQDMLQLAQAGVPAWGLLAKRMGVTTAELRKMSEAGKLGRDSVFMLIDALGDRFKGMTDQQSAAFQGLVAKLTDSWNIAVMEVGEPIFDVAKDSLKGLVAMFDAPGFKSFANYLKGGMQSFFDGARIAASRTGAVFSDVFSSKWFREFLSGGREVFALTSELASNAMQFGLNLQDGLASSDIWTTIGDGIQSVMGGLKETLKFLAVFSADGKNAWHMFGLAGAIVWESLRVNISTMLLRAKEDFQSWTDWLVKLFDNLITSIGQAMAGMFDDIVRAMEAMSSASDQAKRGNYSGALLESSLGAYTFGKGVSKDAGAVAAGFETPDAPALSTATADTSFLDQLKKEFADTYADSSGIRDNRLFEEEAQSIAQQIGKGLLAGASWYKDMLYGFAPDGMDEETPLSKETPKFADAAGYARAIQERLTPGRKSDEVEATTKVEAAVKEGAKRTTELLGQAVAAVSGMTETLKGVIPIYGL